MKGRLRKPRNPGGSWGYRIELGVGADGRRDQKQVSGFPTKREAQAALNEALTATQRGVYVPPSRGTLSEYLATSHTGVRVELAESAWGQPPQPDADLRASANRQRASGRSHAAAHPSVVCGVAPQRQAREYRVAYGINGVDALGVRPAYDDVIRADRYRELEQSVDQLTPARARDHEIDIGIEL